MLSISKTKCKKILTYNKINLKTVNCNYLIHSVINEEITSRGYNGRLLIKKKLVSDIILISLIGY